MDRLDRRDWLHTSGCGLAAGIGSLILGSHAQATEPSGSVGEFAAVALREDIIVPKPVEPTWKATEPNILGPYHRPGAPYRAKITPPLEPGDTLVVRGRVWGFDTRRPLAGAALDVWQANASGRYDNDDPMAPPAAGLFYCRARVIADETGYYEYQTVRPGRYKIGQNQWRPAHIHYMVRHPGYKQLVTQMYFEGDPENARDQFIRPSLIMKMEKVPVRESSYDRTQFDIVLAPL